MKITHWSLFPALALLLLTACQDAPHHEPIAPGAVVLALGDSITHGTGARPGQDYPTRLALATGWTVINAGIPGDTTSDARARLPALLERHKPDVVIVELGGNDFLRKRQASAVRSDLLSIVNSARDAGALVILVAVPRLSLLRAGIGALRDSAIYEDLSQETGAILVDDLLSQVLSDDTLRADPIHPNAAGYSVFTDGLLEALSAKGLLQ